MRVIAAATMILALTCAPGVARPTADNGQLSWGKLGISFEQYRDDAIQCTMLGTLALLPETPTQQDLPVETGSMNSATPQSDTGGSGEGATMPGMDAYIATLRLQAIQASREARDARQVVVDQCLTDRGYRRFLLTSEQRAHLRTLEHGSEERRRYLYSLATDPNVLETQAI